MHDVAIGPDGFVWIAGPSGLARYDGTGTTVLGRRDNLTTQGLRALAGDAAGRLWIGGDQGVDLREADGTVRRLAEDWSFGFVEDFAVDGLVTWAAASEGLVRWTREAGCALTGESGLSGTLVTAVERGEDGVVWAAGPSAGLWRLPADGGEDAWERVPEGWQSVAPLRTLASGAGGTIIVGGDGGVVELDPAGSVPQSPLAPRTRRAP